MLDEFYALGARVALMEKMGQFTVPGALFGGVGGGYLGVHYAPQLLEALRKYAPELAKKLESTQVAGIPLSTIGGGLLGTIAGSGIGAGLGSLLNQLSGRGR